MFSSPTNLTLAHASAARDAGIRAIRAGEREFDLAGVSAIDSSSVAVLLGWQRMAQSTGGALRFHHLPPALTSLAELYGVRELIEATPPRP